MNVNMTWKLIGKITGIVGLKDVDEKSDVFIKHQVNRYSYKENNKIVFSIEHEPCEEKVKIMTNRFLVKKSECDNVLNLLNEGLKVIKALLIIDLNSIDENYDLIITVDNKTDKFDKTMFTYSIMRSEIANVYVSKNKIQISAGSFESLKNSVLNFVR